MALDCQVDHCSLIKYYFSRIFVYDSTSPPHAHTCLWLSFYIYTYVSRRDTKVGGDISRMSVSVSLLRKKLLACADGGFVGKSQAEQVPYFCFLCTSLYACVDQTKIESRQASQDILVRRAGHQLVVLIFRFHSANMIRFS